MWSANSLLMHTPMLFKVFVLHKELSYMYSWGCHQPHSKLIYDFKKGIFHEHWIFLASLCVCVCDHPPVVSFTTLKSKSACSKSSSFRPQLGLCVKNLCCCTKFTSTAISIKLVSMSLLRLMLILTRDWWNASNCMHFFHALFGMFGKLFSEIIFIKPGLHLADWLPSQILLEVWYF